MRYFIVSALSLWLAMTGPAAATDYPVSKQLIREHCYHDELYVKLKTALDADERRFKALDRRVMRFAGAQPVIPFSHAKRKVRYTPEQIRTAKEKGWVETWRFGWSISEEKILKPLPPWLDKVSKDVEQIQADFAMNKVPQSVLEKMQNSRQRLSDYIGRQQSTLLRLKQWDEWCRKGPWLMEDSSPPKLAEEIRLLEFYLSRREAGEKSEFPFNHFPTLDRASTDHKLEAFAARNLKEKKKIWHWYHSFKPMPGGKRLIRDKDGYRLLLTYEIFGPGASQEIRDKIRRAMQHYWQGSVDGVAFNTEVEITIRGEETAAQSDVMQVYIGGEHEILWPSYTALPQHVDEPTIAHELGHGLGFTDRYRDVYSFSEKVYRSYQWDLFSLMSAQNSPNPVVTEADLKLLLEHYLLFAEGEAAQLNGH